MDNTPGDKLGVWRDMRLADALVFLYMFTNLFLVKRQDHTNLQLGLFNLSDCKGIIAPQRMKLVHWRLVAVGGLLHLV